MQHYDRSNPLHKDFKVELNGQIVPNAVEANSDEGWVRIEKTIAIMWGATKTITRTEYGRVHIVKYIDYDEPEEGPTEQPASQEPDYV